MMQILLYLSLYTALVDASFFRREANDCISPTTVLAVITPSPSASPVTVTAQNQLLTTYNLDYVVCDQSNHCTSYYDTETFEWISTIVNAPGGFKTVTRGDELMKFSASQAYGPVQSQVCLTSGICTVDGTQIVVPTPTTIYYAQQTEYYNVCPYNQFSLFFDSSQSWTSAQNGDELFTYTTYKCFGDSCTFSSATIIRQRNIVVEVVPVPYYFSQSIGSNGVYTLQQGGVHITIDITNAPTIYTTSTVVKSTQTTTETITRTSTASS